VSPEKVTKDVFNLWINHGPQPKDATYAYAVLPDIEQTALAAAAASPPWRVLAKTPQLQAVASPADGLVQAVFYAPGRLEKTNVPAISASAPCVLLARAQSNGALDLTVSDPTQKLSSLTLTIDGHFSGPNCRVSSDGTEVTVPLSSGGDAGSSVTVHLAPLP
jgi:chondroitin AC lyase